VLVKVYNEWEIDYWGGEEMIVEKIIIHNFKSIAKDCELIVGDGITSLVGANQSGKTNVLRAIEKFTSGEYRLDDVCDFSGPGRATEIDEELPMITVVFGVGGKDKGFRGISPKFSRINELRVTKKYNGEYIFALPGIARDLPGLNKVVTEIKVCKRELDGLLHHIGDEWEKFDEDLDGVLGKLTVFRDAVNRDVRGEVISLFPRLSVVLEGVKESFGALLDAMIAAEQEAEAEGGKGTEEEGAEGAEGAEREATAGGAEAGEAEAAEAGEAEAAEAGEAKAAEVEETGQEIKESYLQIMSKLDPLIKQYEDITLSSEGIESQIKSSLPEFIYVGAEYENMLKGEVDLDGLEGAAPEDVQFESIRRLLKLANLRLDQLTNTTYPVRRRQRLANASQNVTTILQKVWEQQQIEVSLALGGANERVLSIFLSSDGGPERYPEHQSNGFRWYLEFYLGYALVVEEIDKRNVFLLDEPGIHLHPLAQRNLVDVLREIAARNQIIHTTHHTDMLDLENPESWRVVNNDERGRIGTFVINKAYLPREGHIGFEVIIKSLWGSSIVPSLLIGPRNLVVEGPSDIILLGTVSKLLGRENVEDAILVNGEITMLHTGGLSHYRRILTFCNRPEFNTVALFDSDVAGRKKKGELIKDHIIAAEKTAEINDVYSGGASEERDLENIFGFNLLKEVAMKVYGADLPKGFNFKKDDLPAKGGLGRRFKNFFESKGVEEYDKVKIAEALKSILLENDNKLTENSRKRFKALISKIRESFNQ